MSGSNSRATGLAVLLFALVAALIVPQLLKPGVAGRAAPTLLPTPPAVGSCVDLDGRAATVVGCGVAHDGEIFANWRAEDPARPRGRNSPACAEALEQYLDQPTQLSGWSPSTLNVTARLVRAPTAERVGRLGWSACVIAPTDASRYAGSLTDLGGLSVQRRPGAFGSCVAGDLTTSIPCLRPHAGERLAATAGVMPVPSGTPLDDTGVPVDYAARLQRECTEIARQLTAAADPTYGAQLTVRVLSWGGYSAAADAMGGNYLSFTAECVLASDGELLLDSVVGLGESPLPVE